MEEFSAHIDHTALGVDTTLADAEQVVRDAERYGMNACIPPCYVADIDTDVVLTTVIGFPHGHHTPETKRTEAEQAYHNGCDELDMVINVGRLKAGETEQVVADIEAVTDAVPIPVKAIIETAVLGEEEKRLACELVAAGGAAFVKTSTGFAEKGATVDDVALMSEYLPVKASGGIDSYDHAKALIEAGAQRIGSSSGVQLVEECNAANNTE